MKINAKWLQDIGSKQLFRILDAAGHRAYFVGGCVRNALLEYPVSDLDIATDALPSQVMQIAKDANLQAIPTGIEHGTVTIIVAGQTFELTTFRKDIKTDGRHATVVYGTNITEDARRRDFTMNALYSDIGGQVVDPLGGLDDLLSHRVKFIDDANDRIQEDYLRILRFFRFHAIYGNPDQGIDAEALAACSANIDGIASLSKERIGQEMRKLLAANNPSPALGAMAQAGVLSHVIHGANNEHIAPLVHLEQLHGIEPNWLRRLSVLGGENTKDRLRLSNKETKYISAIQSAILSGERASAIAYRYNAGIAQDAALVLSATLGTQLPHNLEQQLADGASAKFPTNAQDLSGNFQNAKLGNCLKSLETAWIRSEFKLTRPELLKMAQALKE